MKSFCLFGNHPELSSAEMEAVFHVKPKKLVRTAALYDTSVHANDAVALLGGLVKAGDVFWSGSKKDLNADILAEYIKKHPRQGKVLFGLTVYAENMANETRHKYLPIQLKKALKSTGRKIRWVTGEHGEIRPVTIEKLDLIKSGYDFVVVLFGEKAAIGLTTAVQNASLWSEKDYGRPFRDAKTGMLPPKLARIMVNLAIGKVPRKSAKLLDPFCGGGTILMEAAARNSGLTLIGSDIDAKQVHGAERNMQWLYKRELVPSASVEWHTLSAQRLQEEVKGPIQYIVTEGFLGRPLKGSEPVHILETDRREVEQVWREALPVLASLQPKGGRLVAVWPEYHVRGQVVSLDMRNDAKKVGYNLTTQKDFVYGRPGQFVKRKIVILEKK